MQIRQKREQRNNANTRKFVCKQTLYAASFAKALRLVSTPTIQQLDWLIMIKQQI